MLSIVPLADVRADAVEQLLDRAFGSDRHRRTAYRLRAAATPIAALSFAAIDGAELAGTVQCWPVAFAADAGGSRVPLVMVGPVAVDPPLQQGGIGRALVEHALAAAAANGLANALMLIGDPEYYGRFFGFSADLTALWRVPGPVERHRLLARGDGVPSGAGLLGPRVLATA